MLRTEADPFKHSDGGGRDLSDFNDDNGLERGVVPELRLPVVFFQAEDGIRYIGVTGVQTCALPISSASARRSGRKSPSGRTRRRRSLAGFSSSGRGSGRRTRAGFGTTTSPGRR